MYKYIFIPLGIFSLFLFSCKDGNSVDILPVNANSTIGVFYTDTFSVDLSTVLVNSLPTSESSRLLSGRLDLGEMGKLEASSYFQVSLAGKDKDSDGTEDVLEYFNEPVFDSLVLILDQVYNYGDYDVPHMLSVNRVTQSISYSPNDYFLYNSSFFTYDPSPLGSKVLTLRDTGNEVRIRLDGLGNELFSLARNRDFRIKNDQGFLDYFKGLVLVPGTGNKSVYGYNKSPVLRLYYHDLGDESKGKTYDFNTNSYIHFNRIVNDRSATAMKGLLELYQEISSVNTSNESYLLTGVELLPKLTFPSLLTLKAQKPYLFVNRAELIIHPKKNTYGTKYPLPKRLVLYTTDNSNKLKSILNYYNTQVGELISPQVDLESSEFTYYKFDVTDFLIKQIEQTGYEDGGFILASLQSESSGRTERLVLEKYNIKLKLYVTSAK